MGSKQLGNFFVHRKIGWLHRQEEIKSIINENGPGEQLSCDKRLGHFFRLLSFIYHVIMQMKENSGVAPRLVSSEYEKEKKKEKRLRKYAWRSRKYCTRRLEEHKTRYLFCLGCQRCRRREREADKCLG